MLDNTAATILLIGIAAFIFAGYLMAIDRMMKNYKILKSMGKFKLSKGDKQK